MSSEMNDWRDAILRDFAPNVCELTIVVDPDRLLTEEKLALMLRERGFELAEFNDPIEFRYIYELKYRSASDKGYRSDLIVALHLRYISLENLPYDLLRKGRTLSFDLGKLFPNLSYTVIEKLERGLLDVLFDAQRKLSSKRMGDNKTKDFILRDVFGIATESIINEVRLLHVLLRLHYGGLHLPTILIEQLIYALEVRGTFSAWPLPDIILDEGMFFAFLQERWPVFLALPNNIDEVREELADDHLTYPGPAYLPFDHEEIRAYIENLFLEGKLTPVKVGQIRPDVQYWAPSSIIKADNEDDELRISRLFDHIEKNFPSAKSRHSDWLDFALKWAELSSEVHCRNSMRYTDQLGEISDRLNANFVDWLTNNYTSMISLPPTKPAMLHHVPRRLALDMVDSKSGRVALIVVDGLALDQWVTIRKFLNNQNATLRMHEFAIFAWIPTLTSVSRQALFSGKLPRNFQSSINTTNREEKLWRQFWEEEMAGRGRSISQREVVYQRRLGDGDATTVLDNIIHPNKTKVLGLVIDTIDDIMHKVPLRAVGGMHKQIQLWCGNGFLEELVTYLLDRKYEVWLTSDHGNIECDGRGDPSENARADLRGQRVRIYPTPELRNQVAASCLFAHEWEPIGLPEGYFPLVASGRDAFVEPGKTIVSHGGISMEEVIVPLVKFERRDR